MAKPAVAPVRRDGGRPRPLGDPRRDLGRAGEDIATRHLAQLGYEIVARNVRLPGGELDVVAREGDCLVFVEVRARRGRSHGTPEESITPAKQARLRLLAEAYLQALPVPPPNCRIDVVAVEFSPNGRLLRVDLYRDALA